MEDFQVLCTKDVMTIFQCNRSTALRHMKKVRLSLNKRTSNNGGKGADYITFKQLKDFYGL
jgi:hypothetical protein